MNIAIATFISVAAIVLVVYWLLIERPERSEQQALRRRLRAAPRKNVATAALLKSSQRLSSIGPLNSALDRAGRLTKPVERLIEQADVKMSVGTLLLASGCLGLGVALAVGLVTHMRALGAVVGLLASTVPYVVVRHKAAKRITVFEEQFPEAIALIGRALRAGHAFTTGLAMVAEEAPQPVAGEFRILYDQQNFGLPMPDALRAFAQRIPLLDARFFVTAVLTQREAGGNLAEVLDNLASVIRDRFKVKRQVRVITAHARITGWVLAALPPALALGFMVTSPNHLRTLINDPLGVQMIIGALCLQTIGTLIIRRLVNIEY